MSANNYPWYIPRAYYISIMRTNKEYLIERVPQLIKELTPTIRPTFGLMSAQHMLEHLVWVSKSTTKQFDPPKEEPNDSQLFFKKFVQKGANFRYKPTDKTRDSLDPPRFQSLEEVVEMVPEAISRMYAFDEDHVFYNPMMGSFTFAEMELFHRKHYEHHLQRQFGLGLGNW